jgi:hypothetical protein
MIEEKKYFLSCLQDGPLDIRKISNRMRKRFSASPAAVKDSLLEEGIIELSHTVRENQAQKINHFFVLTGKQLTEPNLIYKPWSDKWEDGSLKSKGNAFDLSVKPCTMFSKTEIAHMNQKYHNNNPITIYSRA